MSPAYRREYIKKKREKRKEDLEAEKRNGMKLNRIE